uniref:RxLR effector candidate protein n=1 Tax=Hyaloperonospora arabidopsidis (strain Emoy2) TaxID=559515 RepID=M4C6G5_HYAAE
MIGGADLRYVLRYAEDSEQQRLLEKAIDKVCVWDITRIFTGWNLLPCAGEDVVMDRLFHYQVNDDFP